MNTARRFLVGLVLVAVLGCTPEAPAPAPRDPLPGLKSPEKLTLYSLDPMDNPKQGEAETPEVERLGKRNWRVLGKIEIEDVAEREQIIAALQEGIMYPTNDLAYACFEPRHAIVAVEAGKQFEIVICFACRNYSLNGAPPPPIGDQAKPLLNDILTKANIELAKETH